MEKEQIPNQEKYWHKLFELSLLIKGFNGVWETTSGFILLFLSKNTISNWFYSFASKELIEDPHDKFIDFITNAIHNLSSSTQTFIALYILIHGLLNIFLCIQLYRDKHWAYLVAIGSVLVLSVYQIYRISIYHSVALLVLTVFDALFIVLAWHEYKYHRDKKKILI